MRILRNFAVIFILVLNCFTASAAVEVPLFEGDHGTDTTKNKSAHSDANKGVTVKKLNISPESINPEFFKAAHWDTIDINMYHVDMAVFRDTLNYTLHAPHEGAEFHPPHNGRVTSGFGPRKLFGRKFHKGIDIDLETGDQVMAAMGGKVRIARYSSGYGNFVVISHEGGLETLYGHMSQLWVHEGEMVDAGTVIGLGGSTGQSTGSHLHFELRIFGEQVDPLLAIDPETFTPRENNIKVDQSWFRHLHQQRGTQFHVVAEEETWESICAMYEMDLITLLSLNKLEQGTELTLGMQLLIE